MVEWTLILFAGGLVLWLMTLNLYTLHRLRLIDRAWLQFSQHAGDTLKVLSQVSTRQLAWLERWHGLTPSPEPPRAVARAGGPEVTAAPST